MRLVQVRDLLQGQGWFDVFLHRMNAPYGLAMHWSRLVDGPLALLVLVSERFAVTAWPLFLLGCVLLLLARIAFALGGRAAMITVLLLTLLCTEAYGAFAPGNIDHHGLKTGPDACGLAGVGGAAPDIDRGRSVSGAGCRSGKPALWSGGDHYCRAVAPGRCAARGNFRLGTGGHGVGAACCDVGVPRRAGM